MLVSKIMTAESELTNGPVGLPYLRKTDSEHWTRLV